MSALCDGLIYAHLLNHIHIFLPDLSLSNYLFQTSKHPYLTFSHSVMSSFSSFLSANPVHHVDLFRYSVKWSGLLGNLVIDELSDREQRITFPLPPTSLLPPKAHLLQDFQCQYDDTCKDARYWQSIICPDSKPSPFYTGILSNKDHRTSSSAAQLSFDHAFTSSYSQQFRPNADNNLFCPCEAFEPPSFDQLMTEFLSSHPLPTSPQATLPCHQRPRPR